jgi:surfactin synthase thioesterase subunit
MDALVAWLLASVPASDGPVALFGHSMGALVAFELAHALRDAGRPEPIHLFASGCRPPFTPPLQLSLHDLPQPELIDALRRMNGTPAAVLAHVDLMSLLIPAIRADFEMIAHYRPARRPPLQCPLTVFGGDADPELPADTLLDWASATQGPFERVIFPGDHFFITANRLPILAAISGALHT